MIVGGAGEWGAERRLAGGAGGVIGADPPPLFLIESPTLPPSLGTPTRLISLACSSGKDIDVASVGEGEECGGRGWREACMHGTCGGNEDALVSWSV